MSLPSDWIAIDTETTGFGGDARIVEIAVVHFFEAEVVRTWTQLFEPEGVNWDHANVRKALEVNGLGRWDLKGMPQFADVWPKLVAELRVPVWVFHNAEFDLRMISQEQGRPGLSEQIPMPELVIDTLHLDYIFQPGFNGKGQRKLPEVARRWGVEYAGTAHRAEDDAVTTGNILCKMGDRLSDDVQKLKMMTKTAEAAYRGKK